MATGKVSVKGLTEQKNKADAIQSEVFITACAKELAARLLAKVIKRTPVGQYPTGSGKMGGTLRRGWTGQQNSNATSYAKSLPITKAGGTYSVEIKNPTEYASYVEYGHRTANHKGWVNGQFMLTISEQELQSSAPAIVEAKLTKLLKEAFK